MTDPIFFGAPWDQRLTTATLVFSGLMLGVSAVVLWLGLTRQFSTQVRFVMVVSAVIPVVAFLFGALMGPRGFSIRADRLRIERPLFPIDIPLSAIREVTPLSAKTLAGSSRTLGSGGFFGYYGRFHNQELGDYRMYATRSEGYVLVRTDRPYILTPDQPDRFIEMLEKGRAGGG